MGEKKRPNPKTGEIYKHFKGNLYQVVTIAVHTETSDKLVVYKSIENPEKVFARPIDMFMSEVDRFRYPFVKAKYRFTLMVEAQDEPEELEAELEEDVDSEGVDSEGVDSEDVDSEGVDSEDVDSKDVDSVEDTTESVEKPVGNAIELVDNDNQPLEDDDTAKYKKDGELVLDPIIEAILDEKEFTKKIENFELLRGKCTDEMLTTLAISLDIQLSEGTVEEKYADILKTLRMHEKYESARFR